MFEYVLIVPSTHSALPPPSPYWCGNQNQEIKMEKEKNAVLVDVRKRTFDCCWCCLQDSLLKKFDEREKRLGRLRKLYTAVRRIRSEMVTMLGKENLRPMGEEKSENGAENMWFHIIVAFDFPCCMLFFPSTSIALEKKTISIQLPLPSYCFRSFSTQMKAC